jgi:hypothetical protein
MSKLPGPHKFDPFSGIPPSRTPGSLGFRDAACPGVIARLGDTPGPVGSNDYAASLARGGRTAGAPKKDVGARWQTFLDSLMRLENSFWASDRMGIISTCFDHD